MGCEIEIQTSSNKYCVEILPETITNLEENVFVIADERFKGWVSSRTNSFVSIEANESNKSLAVVEQICAAMAASNVNKETKVWGIGGGVIQDLTTMATSIYKRGVGWVYVPTTLAGILDSCVGGKSSINVGQTKNLVGNIYPPERVLIDSSYVSSLGVERLVDGLSEGVKITFARGDVSFSEFLDNPASLEPKDSESLRALIKTTLRAKQWFVEVDEKDKKERRLLNFGHTFGHALEGASNFSISHGVAVAIGMLAAIDFSETQEVARVKRLSTYCQQLLNPVSDGLSQSSEKLDWSEFQRLMVKDKKNSDGQIHLITPDTHGNLAESRFENSAGTLSRLEKSTRTAFELVLS